MQCQTRRSCLFTLCTLCLFTINICYHNNIPLQCHARLRQVTKATTWTARSWRSVHEWRRHRQAWRVFLFCRPLLSSCLGCMSVEQNRHNMAHTSQHVLDSQVGHILILLTLEIFAQNDGVLGSTPITLVVVMLMASLLIQCKVWIHFSRILIFVSSISSFNMDCRIQWGHRARMRSNKTTVPFRR